jgi:hypothetical protein
MIPVMEPRVATAPAPRVTFNQVETALKDLPVDLLPTVYSYIVELLEDAEDAAILDARKDEPTQPAEEFFAELDAENARATPTA